MHDDDQKTTMTAEAPAPTTTRAPWTPGLKSKGRKAQKTTVGKRALKLSIEADTHERLTIHALKSGMNLSEMVDKLAREHLNDWVVHSKPGPRG
jgi:hypothetical protein